jgi:PTH1 family peptidyl-tRNA hydrolase
MPLSFPLFGGSKKEKAPGPVEWLIVGLGNPGRKYERNRHNAGWHVLDTIVRDHPQFRFDEKRSKGLLARGVLGGDQIVLLKPQTYMNLSGESVGAVARFYKIPPERILVIYDELDIPLATLRLRKQGGAGGHNGMRSIIQHLGTKEFPRIRVGIGRPPGRMPSQAFLLQNFKSNEWELMLPIYERAVKAVEAIVSEGMDIAMNQFNVQP